MSAAAFRPPRWMIALNLIVSAILAFKTWACFADPALIFGEAPGYPAAHLRALWELGGRNIAMIALGLFALLRPSPTAYMAVFLMGLFREGADMIFAALQGHGDPHALMQAGSFLIFLIPYGFALRLLSRRSS